jgi:hypothetical protein
VQPRSVVALTGHLALGTRVHRALQVAREGGDALAELERVAALERAQISAPVALVYDAADGPADVDMDAAARAELVIEHAAEVELASIMVRGFLDWLSETGVDAGVTLVGTERAVTVPLAGVAGVPAEMQHVVLRGRLDAAVQLADGRRAIVEIKTVPDLTRRRKLFQLDEQISYYLLLERMSAEHDQPVHGVLMDQLRKVKRTAAAKPPFYARDLVTRSDVELRLFFHRTVRTILDMLRLERELAEAPAEDLPTIAYPTPVLDCAWRCEHKIVCELMNSGDRWRDYIDAEYIHADPADRYPEVE